MKLDENYSLNPDGTQWVLNYEKEGEINPKTGKPTISKDVWYHNTLRNGLSSYIDKKLKSAETVDEAIKLLRKTLDEIREMETITIKENITYGKS